MNNWTPAEKLKIRIQLEKYDDPEVKHTFEGTLDWLLEEDDGGFRGYDQARCDAADKVDGDHMLFEDWSIVSTECLI